MIQLIKEFDEMGVAVRFLDDQCSFVLSILPLGMYS
jgi:hypothetical protein